MSSDIPGRSTDQTDQYEQIKQSLLDLGYACPGSVAERFMPCGKPSCRCKTSPQHYHGPYYEWTRKVRAKTVSVRLTRGQAELYRQAVKNNRRLRKVTAQMKAISMRALKQQAQDILR